MCSVLRWARHSFFKVVIDVEANDLLLLKLWLRTKFYVHWLGRFAFEVLGGFINIEGFFDAGCNLFLCGSATTIAILDGVGLFISTIFDNCLQGPPLLEVHPVFALKPEKLFSHHFRLLVQRFNVLLLLVVVSWWPGLRILLIDLLEPISIFVKRMQMQVLVNNF